MFRTNLKQKSILLSILVLTAMSFNMYADCDMMAMISKSNELISDIGISENLFDDPIDFFNYIRERSTNNGYNNYVGDYKNNVDGYGFCYYEQSSDFIPCIYQDIWLPENQAWYLFSEDHYYHGNLYSTSSTNNNALNIAESMVMNNINHSPDYPLLQDDNDCEAVILMGHARQGTVGTGNHPFRLDHNENGKTYTFMHNGTLDANFQTAIRTYLDTSGWFYEYYSCWGVAPSEMTDSELLFHYLMKFVIENDDNILTGIYEAMNQTNIEGCNIRLKIENNNNLNLANFVLSDGEDLYIFRNSPSSDLWHELSYNDHEDFYSVKTLDPEGGVLIDQFDLVKISRDKTPIEYPDFPDFHLTSLHSGWNWSSFPRLREQQVFNGDFYQYAIYGSGNNLPLLRNDEDNTPTFAGFEQIIGRRAGEISLTYFQLSEELVDVGFDNMLFRNEGYKIKIEDGIEDNSYAIDGTRLEHYDYDFDAYEEYWLSYYLSNTQKVEDAFGAAMDDIYSIQTEDWEMVRLCPKVSCPWIVGPGKKTLSYGDLVVIRAFNDVEDFSWQSFGSSNPFRKETPEHFSYEEEADYIPIFIEFDPEDIPAEVAVKVDGVCKGATVVLEEEPINQVCAYILEDEGELVEFEMFYDGRSAIKTINKYSVFNEQNDQNENKPIYVQSNRDYYLVSFKGDGVPVPIDNVISLSNYPNPFNPTVNISFNLPESGHLTLEIFNIKGQLIKTLFNGSQSSGDNTITWNGLDESSNPVASGIYFSHMETNGQFINRKMLLMR
ncbi:MAG: T9SS type A sorting domain-containing protein [Candidatus Cloacimonetes bacterium]|nr:T9SS type A sorting domain-containing protein [Candidatus Cloacimonadota bacterium]